MIPNIKESKEILNKHVKEKANLEHNLLVGYGMIGLAKFFNEDINKWFAIGCLHDIDIEKYENDINKHCVVGEELLKKENIDEDIIKSIKSHNDALKIQRKTKVEHALYSCDGLTGIIRAYLLLRPDNDIKSAKTKSIIKKIKDKNFAASVSRKEIRSCEETLNIELNKFVEIVLNEIKNNFEFL